VVAAAVFGTMAAVGEYWSIYYTSKSPKRISSLSGNEYISELLASDNEDRLNRIFRMPKKTFIDLVQLLKQKALLKDTRKKVTVERQVIHFMHIVAGMTTDQVAERSQCSSIIN
jgi:hypothetical protein